jgi:hypothetical protein
MTIPFTHLAIDMTNKDIDSILLLGTRKRYGHGDGLVKSEMKCEMIYIYIYT